MTQAFRQFSSIRKEREQSFDEQIVISILQKPSDQRTSQDLQTLMPLVTNFQFLKDKKFKERDFLDFCQRLQYRYFGKRKNVVKCDEKCDQFYIVIKGVVSVWVPESILLEDQESLEKSSVKQFIAGKMNLDPVSQTKKDNLELFLVEEDELNNQDESQDNNQKQPYTYSSFSASSQSSILESSKTSSLVESESIKESSSLHSKSISQRFSTPQNRQPIKQPYMPQVSRRETIQNLLLSSGKNTLKQKQTLLETYKKRLTRHASNIGLGDEKKKYSEIVLRLQTMKIPSVKYNQSKPQMRFLEIHRLSKGKSFGEQVLLNDLPSKATIKCETICHFAIIDKRDFNRCITKVINRKYDNLILFLRALPYFKEMARNTVINFSKNLQEELFHRNQVIYSNQSVADKVYIVRKGDFQLIKELPKDVQEDSKKLQEFLGYKLANKNLLKQKIPEISKMPEAFKVIEYQPGSLIGDEDVFIEDDQKFYQCTLKCLSQKGKLLSIRKDQFFYLKKLDQTWDQVTLSMKNKEYLIKGSHIYEPNNKEKIQMQKEMDQKSLSSSIDNIQHMKVTKNFVLTNELSRVIKIEKLIKGQSIAKQIDQEQNNSQRILKYSQARYIENPLINSSFNRNQFSQFTPKVYISPARIRNVNNHFQMAQDNSLLKSNLFLSVNKSNDEISQGQTHSKRQSEAKIKTIKGSIFSRRQFECKQPSIDQYQYLNLYQQKELSNTKISYDNLKNYQSYRSKQTTSTISNTQKSAARSSNRMPIAQQFRYMNINKALNKLCIPSPYDLNQQYIQSSRINQQSINFSDPFTSTFEAFSTITDNKGLNVQEQCDIEIKSTIQTQLPLKYRRSRNDINLSKSMVV